MDIKIIKQLAASSNPEAIISHKGQQIYFTIKNINRKIEAIGYDVFEHLNAYWSSLKEEDQDYIFQLYIKIRAAFNEIENRTLLNTELNRLCVELTDFHDFTNVHEWLRFKSDIRIPDSFTQEYQSTFDQQYTREQTYIQSDYSKLIAMAIILKTMTPIWAEYMAQPDFSQSNTYKEYYSFQLINGSKIANSEAMAKLFIYVKYTIGNKMNVTITVQNGISSEDYPHWMLSQIAVHRLCTVDIRGLDPKANIITQIWKYINQRNQNIDNSGPNTVKDKKIDEGGGDTDTGDKLSTLERYRIKHDMSQGSIVELSFSLQDPFAVAYKLEPSIDMTLVEKSVATAQKLMQHDIQLPQLNLLRWVFKRVVSPKGIMYLDKQIIVRSLGVLEAVLYTRQFKYLALLSTCYSEIQNQNIGYVSSTDSRARIPKELISQLDALFPFQQEVGGAKSGYKRVNPAIADIDQTADDFSKYNWIATASQDKIEEVFNLKENIRIPTPYDIKIQLASLVINVASRGLPIPVVN